MSNILKRLTWVTAVMLILTTGLFWNSLPADAQGHRDGAGGSAAEGDEAKVILVHTPGDELFSGVVHPEAALYEAPFNIEAAAGEHLGYVEELEEFGVEVHQVSEVLLKNTSALKDLVEELNLLKFSGDDWTNNDRMAQEAYFESNLET